MLRVVVDSNVIVSSLLNATTPPARIMMRIRRTELELIVTRPILLEYERVLNRPQLATRHHRTPSEVAKLVEGLSQFATTVQPVPLPTVVIAADPSDDAFIEAAVAGRADYIVSGDRHLLTLGRYQGTLIVTPAALDAYLDAVG